MWAPLLHGMVMLDLVSHQGAEGWLELGMAISGRDLEACAEAQGVEVRAGDVVLVRTGYLDAWNSLQPNISFEQPGLNVDAARWLAARDVVAVGCDNAAVEMIPFDNNEFLAVHKVLLVQNGIYMLEYLNLAELAADRCYEGLITIAPLLVTGATGSPVNPVVIG